MIKFLLALALLWAPAAHAQNVMCPTRAPGDNSNACASTSFVGAASNASIPATSNVLKGSGSAGSALAATPGTDYVTGAGLPSGTTCQPYGGTGAAGTAQSMTLGAGLNCVSGTITTVSTLGAVGIASGARLTLQSHTPVMTSSQTSKSTVFLDDYVGGTMPFFDGVNEGTDITPGSEMTLVLEPSGPGVTNANGIFDIWYYHHSGTPVICVATNGSGGGWASDTGGGSNTSRGNGYTAIDQAIHMFPTNANQLPHCYNASSDYGPISAYQATYVGSICTDAAGAGLVSYTFGGSASGGVAGRLCVWNFSNRRRTITQVIDTGTAYNYNVVTLRQARASAGNQVTFLIGLAEDGFESNYYCPSTTPGVAGNYVICGAGLDSTTTLIAPCLFQAQINTAITYYGQCPLWQPSSTLVGLHTISANELAGQTTANSVFDITSNNTLTVVIFN